MGIPIIIESEVVGETGGHYESKLEFLSSKL